MPSGIFLIGEAVPLETFEKWIEPWLPDSTYNIQLHDKMIVPHNAGASYYKTTLLISLSKKKREHHQQNILELQVDNLLQLGFLQAIEKSENKEEMRNNLVYTQKIVDMYYPEPGNFSRKEYKSVFQTMGMYEQEETASQLFPAVAQKYFLDYLGHKSKEVRESVEDLLKKTLASFSK